MFVLNADARIFLEMDSVRNRVIALLGALFLCYIVSYILLRCNGAYIRERYENLNGRIEYSFASSVDYGHFFYPCLQSELALWYFLPPYDCEKELPFKNPLQ